MERFKTNWRLEKQQPEEDILKLVILDEEGQEVFSSGNRTWLDEEEESNYSLASKSPEMLRMLIDIRNGGEEFSRLFSGDKSVIDNLIKEATQL